MELLDLEQQIWFVYKSPPWRTLDLLFLDWVLKHYTHCCGSKISTKLTLKLVYNFCQKTNAPVMFVYVHTYISE